MPVIPSLNLKVSSPQVTSILTPQSALVLLHLVGEESSHNQALVSHVNAVALFALVNGGTRMGLSESRKQIVENFYRAHADIIDGWEELKSHPTDSMDQRFCNHLFMGAICRAQIAGVSKNCLQQCVDLFENGCTKPSYISQARAIKYSENSQGIRRRTKDQNTFFRLVQKGIGEWTKQK